MVTERIYLFVIDTDSYAGNFEREMCAYITGVAADYDNNEWTERYDIDKGIDNGSYNEHILQLPNEDGLCGPCTIYPNPNWVNDGLGKHAKKGSIKANKFKTKFNAFNSVAIFMDQLPTKAERKDMEKRAHDFVKLRQKVDEWGKEPITIEGFRIILRETTETEVN